MRDAPLSGIKDGLNRLHSTFAPYGEIADGDAIEIAAADVRILISTIRNLRHLAHLAEREIGALRVMEAARTLNTTVWQELDRSLADNVIRPDFGGRP